MIDVRNKTIVKIIAGMLVMAFLAQDIVWANPDTLQIPLITGTLRTDAVKALIEVKLQEIVRSIPLQELKERGYSLVLEERGEKFRIRFKTDAEGRLTAHCDPVTGQQKSHVFIVNDDLSTSEDKPFSPDVAKECSEEGDVLKYPHSDVAHGFMRTDGNGINLYIDVTDLFEGTAPSFKDKDVLVMGCGGGATCFKLALEGAGKVTGVDIDENSIAIAKTIAPYTRMPLLRNVLLRPQPSIGFEVMDILQTMENDPGALKGYEYSGPDTPEFITADARDLSCFQDNSFDYVVIPFMIGVLNGLQDEDVYYVIKEALRVTRPGGILYIEPFSRNVTEESEKLISRIIRLPLEQAVAFDILADIVSYLETDSINGKGLERVGGSSHSFVVKARPVDIVKKAPYEEDIVEHLYTENVAMVSTNISKEAETDFKGAKNLSEVLAMLPDRPLEVLDIGTGNGEFCDNLANMYPGRFRHIIGIDKMMGSSTENETGGAKISIRRNTSLEEFQNDKDNQNRFDIVFSNNTEIIRQHFAEILPKILKPGGIAILTFNWHMALTERYRAFETENSIHEFLDPIGSDIAGSMGLGSTAVANLDGYPDTLYTKIPGFIIIHRLPEGADLPETGDITSQPKPFAATENTERNEWKIVKKSLAGMAEELSDGLRSRLPASFREHFAVALRRVMSGIRDIEKPSPSDVYGLKKDLAMALRILNSTIAYKLSINSTQLKGMFTDDFVISSGLQSGIEASLAKNDFIPSYKDADGHAGQLEEIMHIDDALTSIHSRISWLSRVLESRENKADSPDSAEPVSIRQDFDVWTDSITYDISQLPYYSSEIQEGISVISVMYAHLLLNSYDAVIKRVESGEEYDYLPKIKIRISLVDAGEGGLVLRGSLEDNGTGVSEAALQQLMEEKITTKSVQASDGTNQKISASDFGGVGLGVLNAISKLTIAFPGRSSIVLTTESSDGAFIKMFDPSSGTSTISDIPESDNGRGTNIEINIKLTPGQNVEKGVIYESLWAPQSKPFAPDMVKEGPADSAAPEDAVGHKTDKGIYKYKKILLILGGALLIASFDPNNYLYCGLAIRIPAMAIGLSLMLTSAILYYKSGQSDRRKAGKDLAGVGGEDKPFPPDMAEDGSHPRKKLRQFRDEVAIAKSRLASAQVTDRFGFLMNLIALVLGRDRKMGELMAHVLAEEVEHDPEMPKYRLEFDRETAEEIIKACPSVKFKVCSDGWRVHTELQDAEDVYTLKVLKNSLDITDDPEEDEPVIINSRDLLSVKQEWRGFDLPAQLTGALTGVLMLFIASNLFACSMWWSLLVAPIGFLSGGALRRQALSRREGELISLWDAYQIINDSLPKDKPFSPDMAKEGPDASRLQDVERIAEEAFKRFENICLEQIRLIRQHLRTGQYEKMATHLKKITDALRREFEDPRIEEFKTVAEDMMQDFYAIQLFIDQKNDRVISKLMDNAEEVFKGFRQLVAAGKILEAGKARVSSGVFDLSRVLGNDKLGPKPSPDMAKEEIALTFRIARIDLYNADFADIVDQITTIRRHLGNDDPPGFISRFIQEDMPLSFVAFHEGQVAGYLLADDRENQVYIDLIEVEPNLQNGGIGSSLLATAIRISKENGNSSIRLHVERKNRDAIRLYRRFGFKEDPEMKAKRLPGTIYILDLTKEQIWPYMAKPFAPDMASNDPGRINSETVENETKAKILSREVKNERRRIREIHRRWPAAITTFGSARIPSSDPMHAKAKEFGAAVYRAGLAIRTGAGPSLMEAPLQGYVEARKAAGDKKNRHNMTQGVRIELPFEQKTSKYVEDCYTFKHFVNRKAALYEDCLGIAVFPGGFGTLDEMLEVWSRQQPMVLIGKDYWEPIINTVYEKWRHSGWRGKIEVNFIISDSIDEALEYLHSANNKITPNSLETTDKAGNDIGSLLTELYRWPAAVTIVGQSEFTDRREADIIAEIASHLVSSGVPVRSGTANRYLKMVLEDAVKGNRDKLQAVLAVPSGRGIIRTERRICTDNIEDYQVLLAENSLGYVFLPGRIKTLSRLFDLVSTMQTGKAVKKPIVLVGRDFWQPIKDALVNGALNYPTAQLIKQQDANLLQIVDTSEEALRILGFDKNLDKPFAPDMERSAEDENKPFVIDSNRSFEFEGADIEQGEYELRNIPGGCIYPVIEISINGRQYKVGDGFYVVITLVNGKKIYWSGQHNLSYAFFFKHYGKNAQGIIDNGGVIWRHVDSSGHLDLGHYSGGKLSPRQNIDPDKEIEFGMDHLTGGSYLGYALTTGIVSYLYRISGSTGVREEILLNECVPGSTGSLAGMALKNIHGGVSDIDIDIVVNGHSEIDYFAATEMFEKMKSALCDVAEQGDVCFITNSSELSTTYLGAPLYINPYEAVQFSGEVIAELAKRSIKPFAPDMAKSGEDLDLEEGAFVAGISAQRLREWEKQGSFQKTHRKYERGKHYERRRVPFNRANVRHKAGSFFCSELGKFLRVDPDVYVPSPFLTSFTADEIGYDLSGQRILDLGTGTGVFGLIALKRGASGVVFADIKTQAIACAKNNAARLGYNTENTHQMEFACSDLFFGLAGEEFDLIMFTPSPVDGWDFSVEGGYRYRYREYVDAFFNSVGEHLAPSSRIVFRHTVFPEKAASVTYSQQIESTVMDFAAKAGCVVEKKGPFKRSIRASHWDRRKRGDVSIVPEETYIYVITKKGEEKPFAPDMAKEGPKTITPKQARRGELIRRVMGEIEAEGKRPTATRIKEKIAVLASSSPDVEALTFDQVINSLEANGIKLQERSIDDAKRIEQIKKITAGFFSLHNRKPLLQEVVDLMNAESRYRDVTYDNLYKWFEENSISLESLGVGKVERSAASSLKEIVDAAKRAAAKKGSNNILQQDIRAEMNNIKPAAFSNRLRRLRESGIDVMVELGKLGIRVAYSEPSGRPKGAFRKSPVVSGPEKAAQPQQQIQPPAMHSPKEPDIQPLAKIDFLRAYDRYRKQAGGENFMEILKLAAESEDWLFVYTMARKMESGGVKLDRKDRFYMEDVKEAAIVALQADKPFAPDIATEESKDVSDGVKLKPKRIFNQSPDFLAAVDYFNNKILVKGSDGDLDPIDWDRIMDLYEIFRGDRKNTDYTPGLRQARMGFPLAARIVDAANTRFSEPSAVLAQALQIYKLSLLQLFIDQPGFREKAVETHQAGDEPHPASGHNRLAWFLMNYFLIRNGYQPFYFKNEDEYDESSIYLLKLKEMIRERVIRKGWAELQAEEDEPDKEDTILFEKSFEIKLPSDRETAEDFRSRALNFIYGLRHARDTKIPSVGEVKKRMHKREGLFRDLKEKTGDNPFGYAREDLVNVWSELLNNAHDGLVARSLSGELRGNGIVKFKGWIRDGMLIATIEDHGTGVDFHPNGSLVITPKTHEQGFLGRKGIGAKLAEAIIVLKGGEIKWKNLSDGGTRVVVNIPSNILKTSQAVLGLYEDPIPQSPSDARMALKPDRFLRDIVDTRELTQNMIEGILSALFSNKRLTLAFSKKLKGLGSAELRIVVRRLKEWKEATAQNNKRMKALLDNLTILEYDDLRQALADNNIDANAGDGLIFTYAPKPADESENTANIGSAVRPVYVIEQDGEFPVHYYYPLLEMVTISLAKELLQWDGSQLKEALLVSKIAVDTLGLETTVDEKFGILIFKVLPRIERYNNNSRVDRYTKLLQFLRSA